MLSRDTSDRKESFEREGLNSFVAFLLCVFWLGFFFLFICTTLLDVNNHKTLLNLEKTSTFQHTTIKTKVIFTGQLKK